MLRGNARMWCASLSTSSVALSYGVALVLSATLIPALQKEEGDLAITLTEGSLLVSIFVITGFFGSLLGGVVADLMGRRLVFIVFQLPMIVSWVLVATTKSKLLLYVARSLAGLTDGALFSLGPVYQGEISPTHGRGALINLPNIVQNVGIVLGYTLGYLLDWRTASMIMVVPNITSCLLVYLLAPETPYYLISVGKEEAAKETLLKLRGRDHDPSEELAELQNRHKKVLEEKCGNETSKVVIMLKTLLSMRFLKPAVAVAVPNAISMLGGTHTINMFMVSIFQAYGTSTANAYSLTIAVGVVQLLCSIGAMWTISKLPRRHLLLSTLFLMSVCLAVLGTASYAKTNLGYDSWTLDWVPLVTITGFYVFYSLGYGSVIRVLCGELFPTDIRSIANGISTVMALAMIALSAHLYPLTLEHFGFHGTFWLYALSGLLTTIYCFVSIPETKGKSLVNIEEQYDK